MISANLTQPSASLEGKSALVTGGGRGIGRAISLQLARKGITSLAITYVSSKSSADAVAAECLKLGAKKAIVIKADILNPNIGPDLIKAVLEGLDISILDIIVNNAAVLNSEEPFQDLTVDEFGKLMQGNVFAPMSIVGAALPLLPSRNGRIINISSIVSRMGLPDPFMSYGASKAALDSFTRSLAVTFGASKLATFNSVSVGATKTEAMEKALSSMPDGFMEAQIENFSAEKRFGEPDDVAMIVAWLASEESRWINGASVQANGGNQYMLAAQG